MNKMVKEVHWQTILADIAQEWFGMGWDWVERMGWEGVGWMGWEGREEEGRGGLATPDMKWVKILMSFPVIQLIWDTNK